MTRLILLSVFVGVTCLASGCRTTSRRHIVERDAGRSGLTQSRVASVRSQSQREGDPLANAMSSKPKPGGSTKRAMSKVVLASYSKQKQGERRLNGGASRIESELRPETEGLSAVPTYPNHGQPSPRPFLMGNKQSSSFTLEQAEQYATSNNPDLMKTQAEIESLQGKYLQVGLKPNPQVGYLSADVGEEGTAGQQGGFFSQEFIRGGKLKLNRSIVCQEIEAAKQQLEINRQKLLTEVRQRFYDLLVAQERVNILQNFEQLTRQAVSTSNNLFEAEEISRIANLRAKLQAKNTAIVVEQASNELAGATRRFVAATGMGQPDAIEANSITVIGEVYPQSSQVDLRGSLTTILSGSPELAQALAELERAKWNLNRQIAEPARNVQVQTSLTHSNVSSDDLVGIQVGVPLRINDRNQGNISSARSDIAAKTKNIESIQRDLSKRFSVAWRDYENARIQLEKYQNEIIPETSEVYELVASAFAEGEIGYLDLVTAQQAYLDASLKNLTALQGLWRSVALIDGYLLSEN